MVSSRLRAIRTTLTMRELGRLAAMFGSILAVNVAGWAIFVRYVMPGILTTEMHLHGAFWNSMANFNINVAGFRVAALFVAVWAATLLYWRLGQVEARWSSNVAAQAGATDRARPSELVRKP